MKYMVLDSNMIGDLQNEIKNNSTLWKKIVKKAKKKEITFFSVFGLREEYNKAETSYKKTISKINRDYFECEIIFLKDGDPEYKKNAKKINSIPKITGFDDQWFLHKCRHFNQLSNNDWVLITDEKKLITAFKELKRLNELTKIGKYLNIKNKKSHNCI